MFTKRSFSPKSFSESELIITPKGCVYHLGLKPGELARTIVIVGDPQRVSAVSDYFDHVYLKASNREFVTHTGRIGHLDLSVISSGMGADNIDILINECDVLHNVNFETRCLTPDPISLNFLRFGTTGSLQADIEPGTLLRSDSATGSDGLPWHISPSFEVDELDAMRLLASANLFPLEAARPYFVKANGVHHLKFDQDFQAAITVTMNGFYAAQSRWIGLRPRFPDFLQRLTDFRFEDGGRFSNLEMETSAIYAYASALGHNASSLTAVLANRVTGTFATNPEIHIHRLIQAAFSALTAG